MPDTKPKIKTKSVSGLSSFLSNEGRAVSKIRATKQDSLNLYNNTNKVRNFYAINDYEKTSEIPTKEDVISSQLLKAREKGANARSVKSYFGGTETEDNNKYYKKLDENRYLQREIETGRINYDAPMTMYDKRIKPNSTITYKTNSIFSANVNDHATIPTYDPLSVKPWQMLTPSEKRQRVSKFGTDGTPLASKVSVDNKTAKAATTKPVSSINKSLQPNNTKPKHINTKSNISKPVTKPINSLNSKLDLPKANQTTPDKLDTIPVNNENTSSNTLSNRNVTRVKYKPSTVKGYEKMREYGTYSKDGEEVEVPKSAIQSKYKNGTMGIKVKSKYKDGVKDIKPKTSMDSDATTVNKRMSIPEISAGINKRINLMSDKDLEQEWLSNRSMTGKNPKSADKALTELTRRRSKYSKGTKGIKTKKMC